MRVILRAGSVLLRGAAIAAVLYCAPVAIADEGTPRPAVIAPSTRPLRRRPATAPVTTQALPPVPGVGAQQSARERIRSIYASDYANTAYAAQRALARKLIEQGDQTRRDSDAKFVFYREARDVAAAAGDVPTAFDAIDHLAAAFPVAKLHERIEVLEIAVPLLNNPSANALVTGWCIDLVDQCVVENEYDRAGRLLQLAAQAAGKSEKRAYASWVRWREVGLESLRAEYELARPAETMLKRAPDHPSANLAMGKFVCLVRKDWDTGLQMLAKGDDRALAELAERDLQCVDDRAVVQCQLGDAWWEFAERQSDEQRPRFRQRAAYWYRLSLPGLDGLDHATAERRIAEVSASTSSGPMTVLGGAGQMSSPASLAKPPRVPRPPDVMPFNGHVYRVSIAEIPWETAVRLCEEAGGTLVCMETRLENDYVVKLARGRVGWIGASVDARGRWKWLNGTDMFFSYWGSGEPDMQSPLSRPQLGPAGSWRSSTTASGYVCEWDSP